MLYFIGDSHSGVLAKAAKAIGRDDLRGGPLGSALSLASQFFAQCKGEIEFSGVAKPNFEEFCRENGISGLSECRNALVVSVGLAPSPFYGHRIWRDRYSFVPERNEKRMILSRTVIRQMIDDWHKNVLEFYDYLFENELVFAAVAGPRPQTRHRAIEVMGHDKILELFEMFERPVREKLAAQGCILIEPPELIDDDGMLPEKYWGADWAHGNQAYAEVIITEIDRLRATTIQTTPAARG